MRINALEIDGYGVWSGLRVERISDGINVLYGPNEAGKTTLLQFIRSMLYGFSAERQQYLPPLHGGKAGGIIDITGQAGRFEIARHLMADGSGTEEIVLTAPEGTRHGEHLVKVLLSNIDETIFNNVFAVELRELQELATLGDTEAAELLYNLTAGLDRISIVEVLRELETSRNRILEAEGNPSQVTQLWAERERLRAAIDELGSLTRRWSHLAAERSQIDRDLIQIEEENNQNQRQLRIAELALALRDRWSLRKSIDEQLAALGPLPPTPEGTIERLDKVNSRLKKYQDHIDQLHAQEKSIGEESSALKINETLRRQTARIEALQEQETWLASLQKRIGELDCETTDLQTELAFQWKRFGLGDRIAGDALPAFSSRSLASLRSPAAALRRCKVKFHQAQREQKDAGESAETLSRQIEAALSARQEKDFSTAMDKAGNLVAQYRRRLQIDERLDQLSRHQSDLVEQSRTLVEHQLLPVGVLAGLGAVFVLGVVLILAGLFMSTSLTGSIGWALAILGLAGVGAAIAGKFLLEKSRATQFDSCQKQLAMLQSQVEQTKNEREQLDAQLPRGGGPIAGRLDAAEKDIASLEELVPLEARRNSARQLAATATGRVAEAKAEYKAARRRWDEALKALGLPRKITTRQARQLAEHWQHLAESQRRLGERRDEVERRRSELDMLTARIGQVAADAEIALAGKDPMEHLKQLSGELVRQEAEVAKLDGFRRKIRHLRIRRTKCEETISRLKHRRRELFFEVGAEDETEFRQRAVQYARAAVLRKDRNTLNDEIAATISNQCSEDVIRKQLEEEPARELESRCLVWRERLAAIESQIRLRMEKRGELTANIQILAEDRQLSNKQLELAMVEKRLEEAINRWQLLASTCRIMNMVRTAYERERQPETLQEASGYLNRFTQGRYQRVWTPLGENVLRVDDGEGHCLPVEMLSRGTREQLFLSLRMALAASYSRRGAALPLVLDDVLVNFDTDRAAAAAAVLRDFAATGHQLLVFTCHEHISNIFASLGVPVSRLPSNNHAGRSLITFDVAAEKAEIEAKPIRNRMANKRKSAAKEKPAVEEADVVQEPIVQKPPKEKTPQKTQPKSDAKSSKKSSGVFDADFFDSSDSSDDESDEIEQDQSVWEDDSEEDEEVFEYEDDENAEAA